MQRAIYKNQSQPLLTLLPPSLPSRLLRPPPCPEGPAPSCPAQPDHMAFAGSPFQYQPAKAAGSCRQVRVGSPCTPGLRALREGSCGMGSRPPTCPPLRQAWTPLEGSQGWGRRPAEAWSPSLPALPPPAGPGRLSRSLRNVTRPGVRGGREASAPACQPSLALAQLPLTGVAGGRGHSGPRGQQNELCGSSTLGESTFHGPSQPREARDGRQDRAKPSLGMRDRDHPSTGESRLEEGMGGHTGCRTESQNPSPTGRASTCPVALPQHVRDLYLGVPGPGQRDQADRPDQSSLGRAG